MKHFETGQLESQARNRSRKGFSLIELMVAMTLFIVIAGAAFSVFNQHAALAVRQQSLSGVNIGLRNGMAQLQMDLAGAGQNLLSTVTSAPSFDLGLIIQNNVPTGPYAAPTCAANTTTWAYPTTSACFDGLTIFNIKPCTTGAVSATTAPVLVVDDTTTPEVLSTTATSYADDPMNSGVAVSLTSDATCFKSGDELLYVEIAPGGQTPVTCHDGTQMFYCLTTTTLTAGASKTTVSGANVIKLPVNLVAATGQSSGCPGSSCSDSLGILGTDNFDHALQSSFPNTTTYIVDLGTGSNDISYAVQANPSNAADPQLMRCSGASCTATNGQVVTDQVIGFKVGAALWDNAKSDATDIANYYYDSSKYCSNAIGGADCVTAPTNNDPWDFALVRSVRISMIARTVPQEDQTMRTFQNGFDQGPYLVQQTSVVVDLRNMSIPDFGN